MRLYASSVNIGVWCHHVELIRQYQGQKAILASVIGQAAMGK